MKKKVTVIGCGSTGMATAAYLTQKGCAVTLCDTEEQSADFSSICNAGGIYVENEAFSDPLIPLALLSNDFETSVKNTEVIFLCISAGRHQEITNRILPYLQPGHLVLFIPGNMGSVFLRRALQQSGKQEVLTAEMSGNLWACRRVAPGRVLTALPFSPKKIAALPGADTEAVINMLSDFLPAEKGSNILETTLNSPNVITHVGGSLLNAVQIEKRGDEFALFTDGLSDVFIHCTNALEEERDRVLAFLSLQAYGPPGEGLYKCLMNGDTPPELRQFQSLKGPSSLSHRYVSEDAGCGVALLVSLGKQYHLPTPITESFLKLASHINQTDYLQEGRTLENLGFGALSAKELNEALELR